MGDTAKRKTIIVGVEDFKEIVREDGYFVDKTRMIQKLITDKTKVTLFTRPRRFGKTLNQSMIRRFFEDERNDRGEKIDNSDLFDGLAVSRCGEEILKHRQQYPVISLTLKSAKQPNYALAYMELKKRISEEYKRHKYVLSGDVLSKDEIERFQKISAIAEDDSLYTDALGFLSACLARYHEKNTIILIDEYDVPLENAYFRGFYTDMIDFIRSLFESALKTNPYLERGIITGCLRISKESIFTGLNNLVADSVLYTGYADSFGFTEAEVEAMLAYYGLTKELPEVKQWYDGYLFQGIEIYNPWSMMNYTRDHAEKIVPFAKPYWSNTSSNSIIREMIGDADDETREDLETLMNGGTIEKRVHEDITYGDIHQSQDNLWNFLFFTGYLKKISERNSEDGESTYLTLAIPNTEIKTIYRDSVQYWFDRKMKETDRSPLIRAFETGDCEAAEDFINSQLMDAISYYDYAESYYHGFMTGLLTNNGRYRVLSNRESGTGRPDIVLIERKFMGCAIILELKTADGIRGMAAKCEEGLAQIEAGNYAESLADEGCRPILHYAICFYKKGCMVKKDEKKP